MIEAAVAGCGRMGAFTSEAVRRHAPPFWFPLAHAEAIAAHPGLRLAAVADMDLEAATRAAAQYGADAVFQDAQAMLAAVRPGLFSIATRTPGRAALAIAAIGHGCQALHLEKPLCGSVQELDALAQALSESGAFLTLGAIRRHLPPYRAALAEVASETLGRLVEVHVHFGAAPLLWTHPHSLDILLAAAAAPPVSIEARLRTVERDGPVVINDPVIETVTIRFADGLIGRIGQFPGSDFVLVCERGALSVDADGWRSRIFQGRDGSPYPLWEDWPGHDGGAAGPPGGTWLALDELVRATSGDPAAIRANARTALDALLGQRLLFAIVQSHLEGGRAIGLEAIDPALVIRGETGGRPA